MKVRWRLYRFDYDNFELIGPSLRDAVVASDFECFEHTPDTDRLILRMASGKLRPVRAKHVFIITHCCKGMPIELDSQFSKTVATLMASPKTEDVGNRLGSLLDGSSLKETWLEEPANGVIKGYLNPLQTLELHTVYAPLAERLRVKKQAKGQDMRHFLRMLFNLELDQCSALRSIWELIKVASESGQGIALIAV